MSDNFVRTEYTEAEKEQNRKKDMELAFLEESGLEGADANYLRKTLLSSEEAIAAKTEQMEDIRARKSRKADWDEYIDFKRRFGRALHHSELIANLKQLIPNLYVTEGVMRHKDGSIDLGLYIWDRTAPFENKTGGTVYLGYLHSGWNPEYEIDIVNDVGIAVRKLRGWRTTLLNMIDRRDSKTFFPKSLFGEYDALNVFGQPTNGATASNYRERLWRFRNTSPDRAKQNFQILEAQQKYRYA